VVKLNHQEATVKKNSNMQVILGNQRTYRTWRTVGSFTSPTWDLNPAITKDYKNHFRKINYKNHHWCSRHTI